MGKKSWLSRAGAEASVSLSGRARTEVLVSLSGRGLAEVSISLSGQAGLVPKFSILVREGHGTEKV